jgi:hypothetical protein
MIRASAYAGNFGQQGASVKPVWLAAEAQISLSTAPGKIVLTAIPSASTSARNASEKPARANLLAQYAVSKGRPRLPRI